MFKPSREAYQFQPSAKQLNTEQNIDNIFSNHEFNKLIIFYNAPSSYFSSFFNFPFFFNSYNISFAYSNPFFPSLSTCYLSASIYIKNFTLINDFANMANIRGVLSFTGVTESFNPGCYVTSFLTVFTSPLLEAVKIF